MVINNYSLEDFEKPEDKQKSRLGAGIYMILVLIIIAWPWFMQEDPFPEAEGLMASFGNVEIAGGGSENPSDKITEEPPQEEVKENTPKVVETETVETETVEDETSPAVNTDNTKTDNTPPTPDPKPDPGPPTPPKPKVNSNAMFPGGGGGSGGGNGSGSGNGNGAGKQGTPDGKGDLGGTGKGDKGDGDGAIGNRATIKKCEDYKTGDASWSESGKAVFRICVNASGDVISSEFLRKKSTITSSTLIGFAKGCSENYKYEAKPGAANACGEITISFGLN